VFGGIGGGAGGGTTTATVGSAVATAVAEGGTDATGALVAAAAVAVIAGGVTWIDSGLGPQADARPPTRINEERFTERRNLTQSRPGLPQRLRMNADRGRLCSPEALPVVARRLKAT